MNNINKLKALKAIEKQQNNIKEFGIQKVLFDKHIKSNSIHEFFELSPESNILQSLKHGLGHDGINLIK